MLSQLVTVLITTVKGLLSGADLGSLAWRIAAAIPIVLSELKKFAASTPEDKIDSALAELDLRTGVDAEAIDLILTLPADKEEELFDAVKTITRVMVKHALKLDGYYSENPNNGLNHGRYPINS